MSAAAIRRWVLVAALTLAVVLVAVPAPGADSTEGSSGASHAQAMAQAVAAQEVGSDALLGMPGVAGTGVGTDAAGRPNVVVFVESESDTAKVPRFIDGVATEALVVGEISTLACPLGRTGDCDDPIRAGVSAGHPDISAGTLGAYVRDAADGYYALSNNHVFAAENSASIGDLILQPGTYDGGTASNPSHLLGTLAAYQTIEPCDAVFGCTAGPLNSMDAAIVAVDPDKVQAENICGWTPSSTTRATSSVVANETQFRKCGRTTGSTTGTVLAVNVTVQVQLSSGASAAFTDQIVTTAMSSGGDSGSLMVDEQDRPAALLFAGSDTATVGTPIDVVLSRFAVSIVDTDPVDPPVPNEPPTASFAVSCEFLTCSVDASASSDQDGSITDYEWDFGDGTSGSGETTVHTYGSAGTRTVTLTVTDNDNATDTTTRTANPVEPPVPNEPPTASFAVSCEFLTCSVDASASSDQDGSITDYEWDFGDGTSGSGETTVHTYGSAGTRTVTLTVTDNDNATDTTTRTANPVEPPPEPPDEPSLPTPVIGPLIGVVDPNQGLWMLESGLGIDRTFYYGNPGDVPFMGDWNCDTVVTPGLFRTSDAFAYLRNSNTQGIADIRFFFGNPSDIPLAGDFNGDGCDTLSIYRPSEARFYIINTLGENEGGLGAAEYSLLFGNPGDKPVVGDWDGDGIDEIGLHRETTGFFYHRNTLTTGMADGHFYFGDPGDRFIAGDWGIVDGKETPGVFRPSNSTFYFRHTLTQGNADSQSAWSGAGMDWHPVSGGFGFR